MCSCCSRGAFLGRFFHRTKCLKRTKDPEDFGYSKSSIIRVFSRVCFVIPFFFDQEQFHPTILFSFQNGWIRPKPSRFQQNARLQWLTIISWTGYPIVVLLGRAHAGLISKGMEEGVIGSVVKCSEHKQTQKCWLQTDVFHRSFRFSFHFIIFYGNNGLFIHFYLETSNNKLTGGAKGCFALHPGLYLQDWHGRWATAPLWGDQPPYFKVVNHANIFFGHDL